MRERVWVLNPPCCFCRWSLMRKSSARRSATPSRTFMESGTSTLHPSFTPSLLPLLLSFHLSHAGHTASNWLCLYPFAKTSMVRFCTVLNTNGIIYRKGLGSDRWLLIMWYLFLWPPYGHICLFWNPAHFIRDAHSVLDISLCLHMGVCICQI